jgi:hypothetical protein
MTAELLAARRSARRFFWCWLVVASAFSMSVNIGHARMVAPPGMSWWAIALAVVAPSVQVASTHAISHLVRTRASGWIYWSALVGTIVLGVFAFLVSFEAIRALATGIGFTADIVGMPVSAIFPLVIDVSIAIATLCLLAQNPPAAHDSDQTSTTTEPKDSAMNTTPPATTTQPTRTHEPSTTKPAAATSRRLASPSPRSPAITPPTPTPRTAARTLAAVQSAAPAHDASHDGGGTTPADRYLALAHTLVHNKVTKKPPELVAVMLADGAAGLGPTAISDRHNVHHSVVTKVLNAAQLHAS